MKDSTPHGFGMVEDRIRGKIVEWINNSIKKLGLPFYGADQQVQIRTYEGYRYCDIIIWEKRNKPFCNIKLKLPFGFSPYDLYVIKDAERKATENIEGPQSPYFGTWNLNEFVLWNTTDRRAANLWERRIKPYKIIEIKSKDDLETSEFEKRIQQFLGEFLRNLTELLEGKEVVKKVPVDEFFILTLQSTVNAFDHPITEYIEKTFRRDKKFSKGLKTWFIEQGWLPPTSREHFEKVSRQFLYLFVDKLMFYSILRIKYLHLDKIEVPENIKNYSELSKTIQKYFQHAQEETLDYETIFSQNFVESIPIPDEIVPELIKFINSFSGYDFSKLAFKDLGRIYDRLIPMHERHKLGQYYTRDDVVDLINGFCIENKDDVVADFGCGAGTFLVRAYSRLNYLDGKSHPELLEQIWGVDIAKFPAHLSTINLAKRDLSETRNYPNILNEDFFNINVGSKWFFGPKKHVIKRLDKTFGEKEIPLMNSVVGNPPYIRQESLEEVKTGYKQKLKNVLETDWGVGQIEVGGRADVYLYFFLHGIRFLKERGRFGFIVSNSWLDADFGKYLQEFLLKKTKIIAIIESKVERWFEEANINTCIVILERCDNKKERESNLVKFVQLNVPMKEIILPTDDEDDRWEVIDNLVNEIENTSKPKEDDRIKIYTKIQKELWEEGFDKDENKYLGSRWGKYLRAPEIFFKILERAEDLFVPLKEAADVRFGIKTGGNEFFYLTEETIKKYGIEKEFFQPIIFTLKEVESYSIDKNKLKYKVLICHKQKEELKQTNVLKYILWGEESGRAFHKRPTCSSRSPWYSLAIGWNYAPLIFPAKVGERMPVFVNENVFEDKKLYGVTPKNKEDTLLLGALMNSTVSRLTIEHTCRQLTGAQAIADIDVVVVEHLIIPNPSELSEKTRRKLENSFRKLSKTSCDSIFKEIGAKSPEKVSLDKVKPERRELDKIVMAEILGLSDKEQVELYKAVIDLVKSRIERARSVSKIKKVKGVNVGALADSILSELNTEKLKFPDEYTEYTEYKNIDIPEGEPKIHSDLKGFFVQFDENKLRFKSKEEAKYIYYCALNGKTEVKIPKNKERIKRAVELYSNRYNQFKKDLEEALDSQISDRKIKEKIKVEVVKRVFRRSLS